MGQSEEAQEFFPVNCVSTPRAPATRTFLVGLYARVLDALCIQLGTALGALIYQQFRPATGWPTRNIILFSLEYTVLFCFFASKRGLYKHAHSLLEIRSTAETLRVNTLCLALVTMSIFFHHLIVPRIMLLLAWLLITTLLLIRQHATRDTIVLWKSKLVPHRRVLIVGAGQEARRIFSILRKSPDMGLHPVAFVAEETSTPETVLYGNADEDSSQEPVIYGNDYRWRESAPVLHEQLGPEMFARLRIDEVFIADSAISGQRIGELVSMGLREDLPISFLASKYYPETAKPASIRFLDDLHVVSTVTEEKRDYGYEIAKRALDIVVAASLIFFTAPIWLMVAGAIKWTSPGAILFKQVRIGKKGKPFKIYKFRTMFENADKYARSPDSGSDPRVTPAGRFLRKTSLDELPQLLNVLEGSMSLVGPRPEMPYVVSEYSEIERQRLLVDQGMTGFWQLSADRMVPIHERIEYDLYYLEQRGFFFDLAILVHTAFFAMKGV